MSKILVKGMVLYGRYSGPAENYDLEFHSGPTSLDIERTYTSLDEFLKTEGRPIVPEMVRHLPFIKEGIISPSVAASCYLFNCCLIANGFRPHFSGISHLVQAAARLEDENKIDGTLKSLKDVVGLQWMKDWGDKAKKIIEVPEQLENIEQLISYIPKLLTE